MNRGTDIPMTDESMNRCTDSRQVVDQQAIPDREFLSTAWLWVLGTS